MPRGLARAAAYLPQYTDGARRIGAPDEDGFTFAATAVELALDGRRHDPREAVVRPLGTIAAIDASTFAALLGVAVRLEGPVPGASVAETLRRAEAGPAPQWVLVSVGGERRAGAAVSPAPGEGAVALLFDDAPDAVPVDAGPSELGADGPVSSLAPLVALGARANDARWIGDWRSEAADGAGPTAPLAAPAPAGDGVSQGAFVPAARYEESRRSRWRLEADRCRACGVRTFPARGRCRRCGATEHLTPEQLPRDGWTVVASTWIGPGGQPTEFDAQVGSTGPYGVVLAELAPDARATLQVAAGPWSRLGVGARVDTRLRRLYPIEGAWRYGRKAVPAGATASGDRSPQRAG